MEPLKDLSKAFEIRLKLFLKTQASRQVGFIRPYETHSRHTADTPHTPHTTHTPHPHNSRSGTPGNEDRADPVPGSQARQSCEPGMQAYLPDSCQLRELTRQACESYAPEK